MSSQGFPGAEDGFPPVLSQEEMRQSNPAFWAANDRWNETRVRFEIADRLADHWSRLYWVGGGGLIVAFAVAIVAVIRHSPPALGLSIAMWATSLAWFIHCYVRFDKAMDDMHEALSMEEFWLDQMRAAAK